MTRVTIAAIAGLSLAVAGCYGSPPAFTLSASGLPIDQTLGVEQTADQIVLPLGGRITVVLNERTGTGYRWLPPVVTPSNAFTVVDQQDGVDNPQRMPGGGHTWFQVTLRAQQLGPAKVSFRDEGPNVDGEPAIFDVVVKP